mmetsp:Transcript_34732/g.63124  ORF Transcript_34732/g.63124 Transcript_34732/m.63124 type:complete len:183 (-) Transcript_34732:4558-5106(-)
MNSSADMSSSVVLEEEIDKDYEPTEVEVNEYAEWLGMDLENDKDLLWIAKAGLKAPLPEPWKPCSQEEGEVFYFNFETGESVWDHPCDEYHRRLYQKERCKKYGLPFDDEEEVEQAGKSLGLAPAKGVADDGDSLDNSLSNNLGGSGSASAGAMSTGSGDEKKKRKKDKKRQKVEKGKEGFG